MILTAFCDLQFCPVSFDFVTWLVRAMLERDRRGCDQLHVVIVPKEDGLGGFARRWGKHDEAATRWRLWHIVIPACQLAGATVTLSPNRAIATTWRDGVGAKGWWPEGKAHFMGPLIEAGRRGESIPKLKASEQAGRYVEHWLAGVDDCDGSVTLTIRNQSTDPDRNSNAKAWIALEAWLKNETRYEVIVLRDTQDALMAGHGIHELDVDLRLALYEQASINLIGNNGPQELLKFSEASYLIFNLAQTDGWRDHFKRYFGMVPGDQMPVARQDQRMVYKPDSFEVMREEFEKWEDLRVSVIA